MLGIIRWALARSATHSTAAAPSAQMPMVPQAKPTADRSGQTVSSAGTTDNVRRGHLGLAFLQIVMIAMFVFWIALRGTDALIPLPNQDRTNLSQLAVYLIPFVFIFFTMIATDQPAIEKLRYEKCHSSKLLVNDPTYAHLIRWANIGSRANMIMVVSGGGFSFFVGASTYFNLPLQISNIGALISYTLSIVGAVISLRYCLSA